MPDPPPQYDGDGAENENRYAALGLLDDEVVIYDRENNRAWIQSDGAIEMDAME